MAISRMNMERQMRNMGGIMGLEDQRQGYFLGKLVKKITKPIKKIVKSPLGKMALAGAALYGLGGGGLPQFLGGKGLGGFSKMTLGSRLGFGSLGKGPQKGKFIFDGPLAGLISKDGAFNLGRAALTGLGATAIAAPFFMGGDEEEVDEGTPFTDPQESIENIRDQARAYYSDPTNSALYFMPPKAAVRFGGAFAEGGLANIPREGYAEGGIMDLGGMEKDYRTGGFVDLGAEERADDVPARLSKNEFVFTADAVRAAGEGDIDKGAEVMQNMMDNLEAGGTISEESQGMENPAQEMFDQAQMLEGRLA